MSNREQVLQAVNAMPESMLGYVLAYIQGLITNVATNQEDIPNAETIAAMQEVNEMIRTGSGERWQGSTADLFEAILAEDD
jgi:hypothetical protein